MVQDQGTVLTSARLGRGWLGPVSAHSAHVLIELVANEMGVDLEMESESTVSLVRGSGFVKLWESLRAEAWLVMTISTAIEQSERERGGSAMTENNTSAFGGQDPYQGCLSRHLYRNALFARMAMPHRFVAVLQVDVFGLKDMSPQKYRSSSSSSSMEVSLPGRHTVRVILENNRVLEHGHVNIRDV